MGISNGLIIIPNRDFEEFLEVPFLRFEFRLCSFGKVRGDLL